MEVDGKEIMLFKIADCHDSAMAGMENQLQKRCSSQRSWLLAINVFELVLPLWDRQIYHGNKAANFHRWPTEKVH